MLNITDMRRRAAERRMRRQPEKWDGAVSKTATSSLVGA
jgi:hypothetical protein